jgi:hypothetical protein
MRSEMRGAASAFVVPTSAFECLILIAVKGLATGSSVLAAATGAIAEVGDGSLQRHPPKDPRAYVGCLSSRTDRIANLAVAALGAKAAVA